MFCTKCGHKLEADASFCTKCGSPVEVSEEGATAQMPAAAQPTAPAPQPAPAPAPSAPATAPVATPVVPVASPAPASAPEQPKKNAGVNPVAIGGIAAVAVALLVVLLLVFNPFGGDGAKDSDGPDTGKETEQVDGPVAVSMKLPRVDCANFPKVKAYVVISPAADQELENFDGSMFEVTEVDGDENAYTNKVSDCTSLSKDELADLGISKKDNELAYVISFKSGCSDETASRTLTVACAEDSGYEGSAQTGVTPKAESSQDDDADEKSEKAKEKEDTPTVVVVVEHDGGVREEVHQMESGYILPYSDTYLYSYGELAGYSTWELYLARNEIFARHGRGFKNADLRNYFNSCSWYYESYSPSEFDAIESSSGILNSTEKKNAETIKSVERDKGSSYLN